MRQLRATFKKPLVLLFTIILCIGVLFPIAWPVKTAKAATELSAGDIAIVGLNSDGYQDFSFLLLKDISSGTKIYITDKGWNDSTGFFDEYGDGIWQWTATEAMSAGTVVYIRTSQMSYGASVGSFSLIQDNGMEISSSGDQIFLYQGTDSSPIFIAGIHFNAEGSTDEWNWDGIAYSDNTSALPDVLCGVNALWVYEDAPPPTERDNFRYNGSTTVGSPDALRAAINNLNNWEFDNYNTFILDSLPYSFTIDPEPKATITSGESNSTNSSTFTVTITFDEDVSGFTQSDILVGNGTLSNFTNTVVNRVWTVDIAPVAEGAVTVDVADGVCLDTGGNGNIAATQCSIDYDTTAPSTLIMSGEYELTCRSPFSVTFTFNEAVSGFVIGDITVGNGSASNFTNTTPNRVWTADITPSGDGPVTVDVNAGVCTDAAGNGNFAVAQFSVDYDGTLPTVAITSGESDPTNNAPFCVTVTSDEDIYGFMIGDITVGNGSASNFINTTPNRVWTADITPSGDGTVTVDVNAGVYVDAAGNWNDATAQFSLEYDGSAPTAVITTTEYDPTNSSTIPITIAFNEDVSGFVLGDIDVSNGNALNFINTVPNRVWTADISPVTEGAVTVDVNAGVCTDSAGNANVAASQFSIDYDGTSPTVAITSGESDPTNNAPFSVTFTFDEAVSGFVIGDITVSNGSASNFTNTTPNRVWTADITPSGDGAVTVDVNAGVCTDAAGNGNDAATQFSIDYDGTAPTVAVNIGISVGEDDTETITTTELSATDTIADDTSIVYTVTGLPSNGVLKNNSAVLPLNGTFTQQDITDGKIEYSHDGSETTSDSFVFKVSDNVNETIAQTFSIIIAPVNDEPSLTATGINPAFTEGGAAVSLFGVTSVITYEAGQMINALTLTVTNVATSGDELLIIDGTNVVLTDGNSLTTAANSLSCVVSVSGSTATVTLSGTLSCAQTLTLVNSIAYSNTSDAPVGSNRVVTITSIKDSGGTANGGNDTTMLSASSFVTIAAVNDDPTILGLPTDVTVDEDIASSINLSSVTISDDSGANSITLIIGANAGILTASSGDGVTVSGSGSSCLTLTGTVGKINSYLDTVSNIKYTGPKNAFGDNYATLTLTANDGGNTGVGGGTNVGFGTVNMDITAVNDVPTVDVNTGLSLNEGATTSITTTQLEVSDVDSSMSWMSFTITDGPSNGRLENSDNPGVPIVSFSPQNLIDGKILYVHDGSNTTSDSFTFKVNDGDGGILTGQMFSITVNAVDDDTPTMVKNEGLTLGQGESQTLTTTELLATDTETTDATLVYTVTSLPENGELRKDGSVLVLNDTFTQQGIVDGKIQYAHDDSNTTSDSFMFNVSDSNANVLSTQTFSITINSAPVPTITPSPTQTPGENTRTINGTLLDSNGNPKVGYVVELHSTPITAITDSQGRYRFDNVDYTAHTLFVKTPEGQQIASFALAFEEGDEFDKSMTSEGADITYTENTVSVDITIALDGDEDSAEITDLSGVDNPATGTTQLWWMVILAVVLAASLLGWAVYKRAKVRS